MWATGMSMIKKSTVTAVVASILIFSALTARGDAGRETVMREKENKHKENKHKYTNHLAGESSPYLLQHAHNPVDWYPWGTEALEKAKKENKLLLISIGYAACHWCHVMEKESFEDPETAKIMNAFFVCIKVDREERPDIDQVYMNAAQLLSGSGGWPLNAFALPDGRPFYAGTYFPKEQWMILLNRIRDLHEREPGKLEQQAGTVTQGIRASETVVLNPSTPEFTLEELKDMFRRRQSRFDFQRGGSRGAPKFPMPVDYRYLLSHYHLTGDKKALEAVTVTLDNMAFGGIYDQAGGGFARYSTDAYWKVPHFEKMLYDNAQLVSLYAFAYQLTGNSLYKTVVYETLDFVRRELTSPAGGFYSSLDADSEGEEGKFYVWTEKELDTLLGKDAAMVKAYYNVTSAGNWEHGNNILLRKKTDEAFSKEQGIPVSQMEKLLNKAKRTLLEARSKRVRPGLDDKILTAWNGLMISGCVHAYRVFGEGRFLEAALKNARFLVKHQLNAGGRLDRNHKDGKASINAFLDDYAFLIAAFIDLYQATFDEAWLSQAQKLAGYVQEHFYDNRSGMFYYTSDLDPRLIARKMEVADNVIPGSNSVMAMNLYLLGEYFYKKEYVEISRKMLNNVKAGLLGQGGYYANWGILMTYFVSSPYEVAIVGKDWMKLRKELDEYFFPNMLIMGGAKEGNLPLLKSKLVPGQTTIYVCKDKACRLPVTTIDDALEQMK